MANQTFTALTSPTPPAPPLAEKLEEIGLRLTRRVLPSSVFEEHVHDGLQEPLRAALVSALRGWGLGQDATLRYV